MPKTAAKAARKRPARRGAAAPSPRGEETRARLMDAAFDAFRRYGFHGTSMRQIAQSAGVAVGGIYNHFASKDEVFAAVLDAHHPYHALVPALLATEGETLEEFVYDAGRRIQEAVKGVEDQLLPIIFIELVEFQGRHLKAIVERLYPTIMGFAQRLAERRGPLRDVPVPVLMRSLVALTIGHLMTDMILRNAAPFQQMHYDWYGSLLEIYLHGVLAPGAAEA